MNRRNCIRTGLTIAGGLFFNAGMKPVNREETLFPVRPITRGPAFHWFGYYDKLQFDPGLRYVLGMQVGFEHRSPRPGDIVRIGMIDLHDNDRWIELGASGAWGWQQGCMLQWIPGSRVEVIWNDIEDGAFVSRILNIHSGRIRTLPRPVYTLSPDGKWALGTDFARIQELRPGYGYAGVQDPFQQIKAPAQSGLYRMELETGAHRLLFSLEDLAAIPHNGHSVYDNYHWFNHLLVNTDGTRFTFLHRWRHERTDDQSMAVGGFTTRMFTASADGDDLYCIDPSGSTSHFIWRDAGHITAFTRPEGRSWGFYDLEDKTGMVNQIGTEVMKENGHQTYLPKGNGREWILCDNYAHPSNRLQVPYLYHTASERRIDLGSFESSPAYSGEWRCDLHPRSSPDGNFVCIDSPHGGNGRQMYLVDIREAFREG